MSGTIKGKGLNVNREEVLNSLVPLLRECGAEYDTVKIVSRVRTARLVQARAIISLVLKEAGYSLTQTGCILGRRHTAILHLLNNDTVPSRFEKFREVLYEYINNKVIQAKKREEAIAYHQERINIHQAAIDKLKA